MMAVNENLRYFTGGLYLEIEAPHKLVFAWVPSTAGPSSIRTTPKRLRS